ncbi:probable splicing factor 3B subunit 3 [Selaginella moellendorffii]|uniref:probable splicing factor 3B subunit 3 n=1 Tax=Selaginella moellendorffii TaxID=88036 RepID=UPI000D1CF113|nr:probable splicing factor 3B subunit 3 [Selaginella moellendorffii]|eukprot:XP_024522439.1 probable splicing factor 3B subunit 3 [Selaginella moellendorffii]
MAVQDASAAEDDSEVLYLAKCLQKSSVVSHAVCGHIRSPLMLEVVFGKETALELVVLVEDGSVQPVCEQSVFGIIKDMKLLPWNEHRRAPYSQTYGKDLLVLLSDSGKLSFLTFSVDLHRFVAVSQIHLSHPGTSLRELGWLLAVDSRSRAVAVSAIEDLVAIFPTSVAAGENVVEKAIRYPAAGNVANDAESTYGWGTIWSMAFVASPEESHQLLLAEGCSVERTASSTLRHE